MKTCPKCGESSEDQFDSCWRCTTSFTDAGPFSTGADPSPRMKVSFKIFRGTLASWDSLCTDAAQFATEIGPKNLITISHSEDRDDGVVVVWYWEIDEDFNM